MLVYIIHSHKSAFTQRIESLLSTIRKDVKNSSRDYSQFQTENIQLIELILDFDSVADPYPFHFGLPNPGSK